MRTLVIVNPRSGSMRNLAELSTTLRRHPSLEGADIRVSTEERGATALAREAAEKGFGRVVAVGGDGTLHEVVNGVGPGSETTLAVLPLGTGHDFARSLGLPPTFPEALEAFPSWVEQTVDMAQVDHPALVPRYFVNASAGGFSGKVDEQLTEERKASWGPLAYLRSAVEAAPEADGYRATIELDGGKVRTLSVLNVVVANGHTVAGGIPVAPEARIDDGLLDVVVFRPAELGKLAVLIPRVLVGKHLDHDLVEHFRVRHLTLNADPEMAFNLDGELLARTPLEFTVLPRALRVLAPPPPPTGEP